MPWKLEKIQVCFLGGGDGESENGKEGFWDIAVKTWVSLYSQNKSYTSFLPLSLPDHQYRLASANMGDMDE